MTIRVEPAGTVHAGDTTIFNVFLSTDKEEVNAVEGSVTLGGNYTVISLNTAGSIFSLWPNKPSLSKNKISFTGGATSGVSGNQLKVFSIGLKPTTAGVLTFAFNDVTVFKNDGIGTKVTVPATTSKVTIEKPAGTSQNEIANTIISDKTPPDEFEIVIGRDSQTFDGKYFASFNAIDNESGINRYEVSENGAPSVRSGNTYVLQDQNLTGNLTVRAIDNAGNTRTIEVNMKRAAHQGTSRTATIIIIILAAIICFFLIKFLRKRWRR